MATKTNSKPCEISGIKFFSNLLQATETNWKSCKYLRWDLQKWLKYYKPLTAFAKDSILDV